MQERKSSSGNSCRGSRSATLGQHSPERSPRARKDPPAYLDYTWNWESGSYHHNLNAPYRDDRAFIASFPSPRLNKGINRNAQHIKYYFMDNGYLNVMPRRPRALDEATEFIPWHRRFFGAL